MGGLRRSPRRETDASGFGVPPSPTGGVPSLQSDPVPSGGWPRNGMFRTRGQMENSSPMRPHPDNFKPEVMRADAQLNLNRQLRDSHTEQFRDHLQRRYDAFANTQDSRGANQSMYSRGLRMGDPGDHMAYQRRRDSLDTFGDQLVASHRTYGNGVGGSGSYGGNGPSGYGGGYGGGAGGYGEHPYEEPARRPVQVRGTQAPANAAYNPEGRGLLEMGPQPGSNVGSFPDEKSSWREGDKWQSGSGKVGLESYATKSGGIGLRRQVKMDDEERAGWEQARVESALKQKEMQADRRNANLQSRTARITGGAGGAGGYSPERMHNDQVQMTFAHNKSVEEAINKLEMESAINSGGPRIMNDVTPNKVDALRKLIKPIPGRYRETVRTGRGLPQSYQPSPIPMPPAPGFGGYQGGPMSRSGNR